MPFKVAAAAAADRTMKRSILPPREAIMPDTPLRLAIAAALAFPDGSMTASGLDRPGDGRHLRLHAKRRAE